VSIQTRSEIVELLGRHGLSPTKVLGQHFLADPNLIRKIVATAELKAGDRVIEVGVGTGTLTSALASTGATVLGYEIDRRLEPVHREVLGPLDNVEVRYGDVTRLDLAAELGAGPWVMVANLPYNVGTPLLLDVLRRVPGVVRMVLMVQREVADRLVSPPGSRTYGLPSVVAQLHGRVRTAFRVPPQVFIPPPAVQSAVVVIERLETPSRVDRAIELAASAFGQRRKMVRTSIGLPIEVLERAGVAPTARAEDLAPEDYLRLAEVAGG
jgi:16S rRNA (adenine1518-N6/adenine1519-N6)-dimethyltransferase